MSDDINRNDVTVPNATSKKLVFSRKTVRNLGVKSSVRTGLPTGFLSSQCPIEPTRQCEPTCKNCNYSGE